MAVSTKPPSGTRDFLPTTLLQRRYVVDTIERAYRAHGFVPLETPAMERLSVLTGKYGDEGDQLIFKVLKRGEKLPPLTPETQEADLVDLGLRYDLTVPLARVIAAYSGELPRFFRRYQIQPVWRADRPQRGRFREFFQCDVDFVGTESLIAEATVVLAVTDALAALGFDKFTVRINDRRVLTGLMEVAEIPDGERGDVLVAIDKLDKIGRDGVVAELRSRGLSPLAIERLAPALGDTPSDPVEGLASLRSVFEGASLSGAAGVDTLSELFGLLDAARLRAGTAVFDPTLARGLSYYTGPIFEIAVEGLSGSMGGGGRYDGLIGIFRGSDVPAVGFSLGLERILVVMEERGMLPATRCASDVMIAQLDDEAAPEVVALSRTLQDAGLQVEVFPEKTKLGKQFRFAEDQGVRFVALYGLREVEAGVVAVKDLATGTQEKVPVSEVASFIISARGLAPS